jgi:hypothetical protein
LAGNGDKYVGEFKDSIRSGQGAFTGVNGGKYVGEYKYDKRDGQGTFTEVNGDKYVGEYKDDKRNGQGTLTRVNGSIISAGVWVDGRFVGATAPSTEDLIVGMNVISGWIEPNGSGVGVIVGNVTNRNRIAVRSTSVRCTGYLDSGQSIEHDLMIWSVIEPGTSSPFRIDFDGIRYRKVAKCWVVDLRTLTEIR